ncbi:MAG: Membrane-bound lytic murein transglycosylase D [Burkholderiaceae bacterium]|jgi:membrane-bound lytic murein transglycosylase D|nr:MAG: Membrane-bound lytic murein transglycosylase D [Burkholderiaceae bacterium]
MRLLHILCIAGLLWLTGCASTTAPASLGSSSLPASGSPAQDGTALKPITPAATAPRTVAQLTPPVDLWARIRRGFAMPDLQGPLVQQNEQYYIGHPDYIVRMTERSRKYLFYIVEDLEKRNMPTELALLPFVESAFNPRAVSSAKAAGMWQFMPATGKTYDLKQNMFRDDRRDVLASTRAALDYLQKLHDMFGDWQLALAAYNWGEGNVARAIARNQGAGLGTGYLDLNMPQETRNYVPKLQAIKDIVADPQAFNTTLPEIGNHPYFQKVDIKHDIDVAVAAQLAGVSVEDFKELNPAANRPVILAAGTPQILLPWDNAATFRTNLKNYDAGQLASWTAWTVPTTMKASEAAKRVGMSESELRNLNHIPPRMLIKVGSTLLVPRPDQMDGNVAEHVADNAHLALAPEPRPAQMHRTLVRARRGETVALLARRYGQNPSSVASWNRLAVSAHLKPGQHLVVYMPRTRSAGTRLARGAARHTNHTAVARAHGRTTQQVARTGRKPSGHAVAVASKSHHRKQVVAER